VGADPAVRPGVLGRFPVGGAKLAAVGADPCLLASADPGPGGLALLGVIHALARLPAGTDRTGALAALAAGTVALAAAVFSWHFGTRETLRAGATPQILAPCVSRCSPC
jgi:hypothetical protein